MKHIRNILLLALGLNVASCNYLDVNTDTKDRMNIEEVFSDELYTEQWLAYAYSFLAQNAFADISINAESAYAYSDDMYNPSYNDIKQVTYNEEKWQNTWKFAYQGIRQAAIFIYNVDKCMELTPEERADYKAQARFIRAYYYWKLLQKYGPVPIVPEEGQDYTDSYDELSIPRNTYDECAEYIASEMALAAKDLPLKRELLSIARPTRGAALAVRAKVLLYAASPLVNGNTDAYANQLVDDKGKRLLSETYDEKKWARAAAAAKDVMELNVYQLYVAYTRNEDGALGYPKTLPPYQDNNFSTKPWPAGYMDIDPFESYRSVFNGELSTVENPELIFSRGANQGSVGINYMVLEQLPKFAEGNNSTCMTQKQCDAYYMNSGADVAGKDAEIGRGDGSARRPGYVTSDDVKAGRYKPLVAGVSLQYAEREPRFYASVAYNGAVWYFSNATYAVDRGPYTCWYYRGMTEGMTNAGNWLQTGIGVMKFVRPTDTNDDLNMGNEFSHVTKKADPLIRYADILLMYAEAVNELDGSYEIESWDKSTVYTVSRDVEELKKGIQPVRIRAGIPDFTADEYSNKDVFRKKLKRERQIELMGEAQRYFDLRRWKDAADEESLPIYGCNVFMTETQKDLFHKPVPVYDIITCFAEKTYFWPIHRGELQKNIRLTQNPGWQEEY